ncbi:MAG: nuclear transport factor 2 family protein [Alphaproteobacteria bacterium]|nr:nuclear transport factor 2 family protein [Alphaproteobacteria bacterium SS10]
MADQQTYLQGLDRYLDFWINIKPEVIDQVRDVVTPDFRFQDPFNDAHSVEDLIKIFEHMFKECEQPRFKVLQRGLDAGGPDADGNQAAYALWRFDAISKRGGTAFGFEGMSSLALNKDALMASHIDHWDSGNEFFRGLPVLGWGVRQVIRMLAADPKLRRA